MLQGSLHSETGRVPGGTSASDSRPFIAVRGSEAQPANVAIVSVASSKRRIFMFGLCMASKRYYSLAKTNEMNVMGKWKLARVSERFIVMALGLPVPPYVGHPLDPLLRSSFKSRDIKPPGFDSQVKHFKKIGT